MLALFLLVGSLVVSQSAKPKETVLPAAGARIPFELARTRTIPVVKAKVNGQGPFAFLLDTGAAGTVLDEEFVKSIGLELGAEQPIGDPSAAKGIVAHEVAVDAIEAGDVVFKGIVAVAMDRKRFDAGEDLKGILGLPLFAENLFTLDYPRKEIAVAKGELAADGTEVLPYDADGPLPRVEIALGGKKILAHIDSGSPSGFGFPKSFLEGMSWKEEPKVVGRGRTVNNEFEVWSGRVAGTLKLGTIEVADPVVKFNDQFPFANVGYQALKDLAITFDQRNHRVRLHSGSAVERPR
jgi:hypothetical protein